MELVHEFAVPVPVEQAWQVPFTEKDEARHRVVLKASGRDTRGQGNA